MLPRRKRRILHMLRGPLISTCRMKAPIQGCDTKAARDGGTEGGLDKHLAPHPTSGCSLLPPPGPAWLLSLPCRAHPQPLFLPGTRRASHCLSLHSRSTSCTFAEQSLPSPTTSTPRNSPPHTHTHHTGPNRNSIAKLPGRAQGSGLECQSQGQN